MHYYHFSALDLGISQDESLEPCEPETNKPILMVKYVTKEIYIDEAFSCEWCNAECIC